MSKWYVDSLGEAVWIDCEEQNERVAVILADSQTKEERLKIASRFVASADMLDMLKKITRAVGQLTNVDLHRQALNIIKKAEERTTWP